MEQMKHQLKLIQKTKKKKIELFIDMPYFDGVVPLNQGFQLIYVLGFIYLILLILLLSSVIKKNILPLLRFCRLQSQICLSYLYLVFSFSFLCEDFEGVETKSRFQCEREHIGLWGYDIDHLSLSLSIAFFTRLIDITCVHY